MLSDSQIAILRKDKRYQKKTQSGLSHLVSDIIRSGNTDPRPDISFALKLIFAIAKAVFIRRELDSCSRDLLEKMLNSELQWPREPESIRSICESKEGSFWWMRYDAPRVEALFERCLALVEDAEYRGLIKEYSEIGTDKNVRLIDLANEIKELRIRTTRSIATRAVYDNLVKLNQDEFYRKHEKEIQRKFITASQNGALGVLPQNENLVGTPNLPQLTEPGEEEEE